MLCSCVNYYIRFNAIIYIRIIIICCSGSRKSVGQKLNTYCRTFPSREVQFLYLVYKQVNFQNVHFALLAPTLRAILEKVKSGECFTLGRMTFGQ